MSRYSDLAPLTTAEKIDYTIKIVEFFNPLNVQKYQIDLGIQATAGRITALSVGDFFTYMKKIHNLDLYPKMHKITELILVLHQNGLLTPSGTSTGIYPLNQRYFIMKERTNTEDKGILFLGKYIGFELIADAIKYNLAYITGITPKGDLSIGSGTLISSQVILTCRHVLEDMKLDDNVKINNCSYKIKSWESHPTVDFGVIILENPLSEGFCKDIALRNSSLLEKVIIAGFPKIPRKLNDCFIVQSGEIAGQIESYNENSQRIVLELFTAVSRPGNSGGPLLSSDGKLLGIVTQTLEEQEINQQSTELKNLLKSDIQESKLIEVLMDNLTKRYTYPCFASVPAKVLYESFQELKIAEQYSIPWEDYQ